MVKNSNIEGKSVFTLRDFKKGEIILINIFHIFYQKKVYKIINEKKKYIIIRL
jgi:hypothetical protein